MLVPFPDTPAVSEAIAAIPGLLRGEVVTEANALIVWNLVGFGVKTYAFPTAPAVPQFAAKYAAFSDGQVATEIEAAHLAHVGPHSAGSILTQLLIMGAMRLLQGWLGT